MEKSNQQFILNETNYTRELKVEVIEKKMSVMSSDENKSSSLTDSISDQKVSPSSDHNVSPNGSNSDWIMLNDDMDKLGGASAVSKKNELQGNLFASWGEEWPDGGHAPAQRLLGRMMQQQQTY